MIYNVYIDKTTLHGKFILFYFIFVKKVFFWSAPFLVFKNPITMCKIFGIESNPLKLLFFFF